MDDPTQRTGPVGGWHWAEWGCEFLGTGALLLGGLSGLFLDFQAHTPIAAVLPEVSARLLLTGLILGAAGILITVSPLGRRSGAHLNPSVSVAFWRRGHMHRHDLIGYLTAQVTGAVAGTAIAGTLWGRRATALDWGVTQPGHGISSLVAFAIETAMTCVLILGILMAVSSARTARLTPFVAWGEVALLVWVGGSLTGASLNPARSLAPAILAHDYTSLWAYIAGPLAGALIAVAVFDRLLPLQTRTAKLFHDSRYPSTMATSLPSAPAGPPRRGPLVRCPKFR